MGNEDKHTEKYSGPEAFVKKKVLRNYCVWLKPWHILRRFGFL